MIIPDLNLLLYAYNQAYREHPAAKAWLESILDGDELVGFAPTVLFGFIRVSTNHKAAERPFSVPEAAELVRSWLEMPMSRLLSNDRETIELAISLLEKIGAGGNLTSDAQIASLALVNDAVVHTADADFARFPGLRWANPITGAKVRNPE